MDGEDFRLDRRQVAHQHQRHASRYAEADFLPREIARRMDERLEFVLHTPERVLDLGCGHGADFALLARRYPKARLIGIDRSPAMLSHVPAGGNLLGRLLGRPSTPSLACADARALPLANRSIGLAWSNLMLHWLDDPTPALTELHRVLEIGGLLTFSTLGPDSLKELIPILPAPAQARIHRFIDMHDLGDALVRAGFSDPVMDMEFITLTYPSLDSLLRDLRFSGGSNAAAHRPRGLTGKRAWQEARERFAEGCDEQGVRPITVEVVQGHAWKAAPKQTEDGRAIVRFRPRPV